MQHGKPRAHRCSGLVNCVFQFCRVAIIYGPGRTIHTLFRKSAQPFTAETLFFMFECDIFDLENYMLICGNSCCDVAFSCLSTLPQLVRFFRGFQHVTIKTLRKSVRQTLSRLYGLHFHPLTGTFHHHQPSNQNRVHLFTAYRIGVQLIRPTKEPPCTHLRKSSKNRQNVFLTRENGG